jgi:hypothetical protein
MNASNNVIPFAARPARSAPKPWVGPIATERERCLAVCLDPASQGHWGSVARHLLCETTMTAEEIVGKLKTIRAEVRIGIEADIAAGRPLV